MKEQSTRGKRKEAGKVDAIMMILIGVGILLAIAIVVAIVNRNEPNQEGTEPPTTSQTENVLSAGRPTIAGTEYVGEKDGVKINTSEQLKQTKTYGSYTFSNIRIETDANGSVILADVTTSEATKQPGKEITINILDNQGNVVETIGAYIGQIKPGETNSFRTETTTDITNAYDFEIQ